PAPTGGVPSAGRMAGVEGRGVLGARIMGGGGAMYKLLFSALFRRMPAEAAHRLGFALIRYAAAVPSCVWLLRRWLAPRDPVLRVHAFGRDLPGPLGLAAGFDKDAVGTFGLGARRFAVLEAGTGTAETQP